MERREALRNVALLMGGAISASTMAVLFDSCNTNTKTSGSLLSAEHESMIAELADVIIPETGTPGAKAAGVGPFIKMMIEECFPEEAQKVFIKGLDDLKESTQEDYGTTFEKASSEQRNKILKNIADKTAPLIAADKKASDAIIDKNKKPVAKPYFFLILKDLTMLGYFTSETGATKALEYIAVPGRYNGNIDLKEGQKAWAL